MSGQKLGHADSERIVLPQPRVECVNRQRVDRALRQRLVRRRIAFLMAQCFEVAEDVRCVNLRERVAVAALELVADARRAGGQQVDMRDGLALAHERFSGTEDALHGALADGFGHVFGKMEDVHEKAPFVRACCSFHCNGRGRPLQAEDKKRT